MKFIHLANVLLGFDERLQADLPINLRSEKEKNLLQILENAKTAGVHAVIFTGNMFLKTPDILSLMQLDNMLSVLDDIPVIILPGKMDEEQESILDTYRFESRVMVVKKFDETQIFLKDCKTDIFAFGCEVPDIEVRLKKKIYTKRHKRARILLLPQVVEDEAVLQKLAFDYIAVGKKERFELGDVKKIYSPGMLQALNFTEESNHGYNYVEIQPKTKETIVRFISSTAPEFLTLKIHSEEVASFEEAKEIVEKAIALYGENNLYRVSIDGENADTFFERKEELLSLKHVVSVLRDL